MPNKLIAVAAAPLDEAWWAVNDRLARAAASNPQEAQP
jgi:hypothetical protein